MDLNHFMQLLNTCYEYHPSDPKCLCAEPKSKSWCCTSGNRGFHFKRCGFAHPRLFIQARGWPRSFGICPVCHDRGEERRDARVKSVVKREETMMMKGCGSISERSRSPPLCDASFSYIFPKRPSDTTRSRPLSLALCGVGFHLGSIRNGNVL